MTTLQTTRPRMTRRAAVPEPSPAAEELVAPPRRFDFSRVDRRRVYYELAAVESWIRARIRGLEWRSSEQPEDEHPVLISRAQMLRRVGGLSYVSVWKLEKVGKFPAPVKIAPRALVE